MGGRICSEGRDFDTVQVPRLGLPTTAHLGQLAGTGRMNYPDRDVSEGFHVRQTTQIESDLPALGQRTRHRGKEIETRPRRYCETRLTPGKGRSVSRVMLYVRGQ